MINTMDEQKEPKKQQKNNKHTTKNARFVTGSIWKHVTIMTLTNSIGLMAMFLVDLIDLYFLNLLGEPRMAASVGFSSQILFYITAVSIGFLVATGILVSQRIGAKKIQEAQQIFMSTFVIATTLSLIISLLLLWQISPLLQWLGARDKTLELATSYASILLPSSVIVIIGMLASGVLRAVGDGKRAMNTTLIAAIVNLCLDPLFIFTFDMGIEGAAWSSVIARMAMATYGFYYIVTKYQMVTAPRLPQLLIDFPSIRKIAFPTILTNLASPIGSTFVMMKMAQYGTLAVAAYATIGRIIPVAFSILFALSGAISPIIGQNFGAKQYQRIQEIYKSAIIFAVLIVIAVTTVIFISRPYLISLFNLNGEAAYLLWLFCSGLTLFFITDGILFSTNAVFNSLGFPLYSTFFNYAKFFLGVIPTVYVLSYFYGAKGVIIGQAIGPIIVTLCAIAMCRRIIRKIQE